MDRRPHRAGSRAARPARHQPGHREIRKERLLDSMSRIEPNCWIGVVSRTHVMIGVEGGFVQLNHGKKAPVQRLKAGDMLAVYSPRESYPDGPVLQAFTAIGTIKSGEVYQVEMSPEFKPYRVDVEFSSSEEAPIKPLIEQLSFIR